MLFFGWHKFVLAALAFAVCVAVVSLRKRFPRLSGRTADLRAIQSMHTRLTPRVGGVAIFGALSMSVILAPVSIWAGLNVLLTVKTLFLFIFK